MSQPTAPPPSLADRRAWLQTLLSRQHDMLGELAQVAGIAPEQLADDPLGQFARLAAFVDAADFRAATEDARTWMLNRLGLYLARYVMARHGGRLTVQDNPQQRFYLGFVVTGMDAPVPAEARLDPFAIAYDAINAMPRIPLGTLVDTAERALA
ncbi:hypothetical protein [Cupriavidus sp. CP313]